MKFNPLYIFVFFTFLSLFSCAIDKGKPIIPEDKMVAILTDYYLTQATVNDYILPRNENRIMYYCGVLERHGVTEAEFDSAVTWYTQNFDVYEKIYDEVLNKLDPHRVVEHLYEISRGKDVALVCYEAPDKFCHRHLVADWLTNAGYKCEEYGYGKVVIIKGS